VADRPLWFTAGPRYEFCRRGSEQTVLFTGADDLGWAVLLEPILEIGPGGEAPDPLSLAGGFLHNLVYELIDHAVPVPVALGNAALGAAAAIGLGRPSVSAVDGNLRYANTWLFDAYDFTVSIDRDRWLATLAPRLPWLELVTPDQD
jgi:hypothetical protein